MMKVGILTQYPGEIGKSENLSGVATFSEYLFSHFDDSNVELTIYANKEKRQKDYEIKGKKQTIKYCWEKGLNPFFKIWKLVKSNKEDIIHIQHELFLYGSILTNIFLFIFVFLCWLSRIKVIIEFHAVIPLDKLNKEFAKDNRINVPPLLAKVCFLFFYKCISLLCKIVIVHEPVFKKYLISQYHIKKEKIKVVPLPCIEPEQIYTKEAARQKLKLSIEKKIIFYFGYISGYKGLDKLVEAGREFLTKIPNSFLYIAGGLHPRMKTDEDYLNFVKVLKENSPHNTYWHGYVQDEEIPILFAAADLMVFPYSIGMSSSGPLAQAIAYEVPFIVSNAFKGIVMNKNCIYGEFVKDLANGIEKFFEDKNMRQSIEKYSTKMKKERNPNRLVGELIKIYNGIL